MPLDAFQLYFSEDVIGHITDRTNLYASQTRKTDWDPYHARITESIHQNARPYEYRPHAPSSSLLEFGQPVKREGDFASDFVREIPKNNKLSESKRQHL